MAVGHVGHGYHEVLFAGENDLFDFHRNLNRHEPFSVEPSDVCLNSLNLIGNQLNGAFSRFIKRFVVEVLTIARPHVKYGVVSIGMQFEEHWSCHGFDLI